MFSSPFIEERLYLIEDIIEIEKLLKFSSPFIEEQLYLPDTQHQEKLKNTSSRPLLSRSGCI